MISFAMIEIATMLYSASGCQRWSEGVSNSHESSLYSLYPPLLDYNSETREILSLIAVRGQAPSIVFSVHSLSYKISVITCLMIKYKYLGVEILVWIDTLL